MAKCIDRVIGDVLHAGQAFIWVVVRPEIGGVSPQGYVIQIIGALGTIGSGIVLVTIVVLETHRDILVVRGISIRDLQDKTLGTLHESPQVFGIIRIPCVVLREVTIVIVRGFLLKVTERLIQAFGQGGIGVGGMVLD